MTYYKVHPENSFTAYMGKMPNRWVAETIAEKVSKDDTETEYVVLLFDDDGLCLKAKNIYKNGEIIGCG